MSFQPRMEDTMGQNVVMQICSLFCTVALLLTCTTL